MKAKATTQLAVFLNNRPGIVADLCASLSQDDISIEALTVLDTVDVGTMRMVVNDVERAKKSLERLGGRYVEIPVVTVAIRNRAGAFAEIARIMANSGVNIEYVYATAMPGSERTLGVFRVNDVDTALKLDYPD